MNKHKLTYWIADGLGRSSDRYSIRCRTKKECSAAIANRANRDPGRRYGIPRKIIVEYTDAFNLVLRSRGLCEES